MVRLQESGVHVRMGVIGECVLHAVRICSKAARTSGTLSPVTLEGITGIDLSFSFFFLDVTFDARALIEGCKIWSSHSE